MKTKEEIQKEIQALKAVRSKVRPTSFFGDDNLAALDAQVQVLEEYMDEDEIWNEWPEEEAELHIRNLALEAWNWVCDDEDPDSKGLAADQPLKK